MYSKQRLSASSAGNGDGDGRRMELVRQNARVDFDDISATTAVNVDAGQIQNGFFDKNRHGFSGAERTCATYLIARIALRLLHTAGRNVFAADLTGQVFGGDFAIAVHQHHERLGVFVLHDQGFDDAVMVKTEGLRHIRRPAVFDVVVGVLLKRHAVRLEPLGGGRRAFMTGFFLAHVDQAD